MDSEKRLQKTLPQAEPLSAFFSDFKKPDHQKDQQQRNQEKNDSTLTVKPSSQKARIYSGAQQRDGEDAQAILSYGERHRDGDR